MSGENSATPTLETALLGSPVLAALRGPHSAYALANGQALRYPFDTAVFAAFTGEPVWNDLAPLLQPGELVALVGSPVTPPADWRLDAVIDVAQYIDETVDARVDDGIVRLGADDAEEMMELVERTKPGPFLPRTVEFGGYVGIRDKGRLIAMAGRRMNPPGWVEVSAVCTDEAYRGQGLASRVIRAVVSDIRDDGDRAFLHVSKSNTTAVSLYKHLGFTHLHDVTITVLGAPQ